MAKIRTDFVTNSSSSSFIILKKHLTDNQIVAIEEHDILGEKLGIEHSMSDAWDIGQNKTKIWGSTIIDNFSMAEFFEEIGIDDSIVLWDDWLDENDLEENVNTDSKIVEKEQTWEELLDEIQNRLCY